MVIFRLINKATECLVNLPVDINVLETLMISHHTKKKDEEEEERTKATLKEDYQR